MEIPLRSLGYRRPVRILLMVIGCFMRPHTVWGGRPVLQPHMEKMLRYGLPTVFCSFPDAGEGCFSFVNGAETGHLIPGTDRNETGSRLRIVIAGEPDRITFRFKFFFHN